VMDKGATKWHEEDQERVGRLNLLARLSLQI
jgi:hypothetical protein